MTLIWRSRSPTRRTWPTPETVSRRRFRFWSAYSEISRWVAGPDSAIEITGEASASIFSMIGGSASRGSSPSTELTLSRTSWAATSPFFSRANWIWTSETFSDEVEISSSMPLIVLIASSSLSVISVSTSSGAAPGRTVVTTTNGKSTSGKRSTPSWK